MSGLVLSAPYGLARRLPPPAARAAARRARLGDLLTPEQRVAAVGPLDRPIAGLASDARQVVAGSVYFDVGPAGDLRSGLDEAVSRGAIAVVGPRRPRIALGRGLTVVQVPDPLRALAGVARRFFRHPDAALRLHAVQGDHGKTTVAHLLRGLLGAPEELGLLSSVHHDLGARVLPASIPGPLEFHALLAQMRDAACTGAVIERPSGPAEAGWMADVTWASRLELRRAPLEGGPASPACSGKLHCRWAGGEFTAPLPARLRGVGAHLELAVRAALERGVSPATLAARLGQLSPVPGRGEPVAVPGGFNVWVDAADRPERLAYFLRVVRELTPGRVALVMGCPGECDPAPRPLLTRAGEQGAELVVLTAADSRGEPLEAILRDMLRGAASPGAIRCVPDRRAAVAAALAWARPGDAVVIAGRGAEAFQRIERVAVPCDDRQLVRDWVRGRSGR
ncbi:MAG: glutamate ligase domain-containing protein [Verrucomicrobiota bacterium]